MPQVIEQSLFLLCKENLREDVWHRQRPVLQEQQEGGQEAMDYQCSELLQIESNWISLCSFAGKSSEGNIVGFKWPLNLSTTTFRPLSTFDMYRSIYSALAYAFPPGFSWSSTSPWPCAPQTFATFLQAGGRTAAGPLETTEDRWVRKKWKNYCFIFRDFFFRRLHPWQWGASASHSQHALSI